jgi:hypothetical protein
MRTSIPLYPTLEVTAFRCWGGAAALEKPTVIKAPQPRVGDIAILLVLMMRRGIASRAVHGGNPRHSGVRSGNESSVYRRETSSGFDMELRVEGQRRRGKRQGRGSRSVSEVGVAVLALVKCECDKRALAQEF